MRWLWIPLVLVTLALATGGGCASTGTNSTSGAGGGSVCDGKGDCNACLQCADSNPCSSLLSSCNNNAACAGILQCMQNCGGGAVCKDQCIADNPSGASLFNAYFNCDYCEQCPSDCSGFTTCN
jgi:hypothetical protein